MIGWVKFREKWNTGPGEWNYARAYHTDPDDVLKEYLEEPSSAQLDGYRGLEIVRMSTGTRPPAGWLRARMKECRDSVQHYLEKHDLYADELLLAKEGSDE